MPDPAPCPRCSAPGYKTWRGDDPKCAFPTGTFVSANWNCGTMNALRDHGAGGRVYGEDESAALLRFGSRVDSATGDEHASGFVLLAWYKNRGRTDTAIMLDSNGPTGPLSLDVAERVLATPQHRGE